MQLEAKYKKIESIRFKLWSVHKLHLTDIYNALLELITLQQPQSFIPMMRECIKASKYDPHLGKYIHLFDILLNNYIFNHLLHGCLAEFYSKIVKHLNMQKLWPWIEQAMIVRKYWLRRIHHNLYDDLRRQTYRLTSIDVDNILSMEAIQQIRCYYAESMELTKQELFYYLPQLHQLYPAYYYSYNNTNCTPPIVKQSDPPQQSLLTAKQSKLNESSDVDNSVEPTQVGHYVQQSNAINYITNPYDTNVNNCFYKLPQQTNNFDFAKRKRTDSEETNAGQKIEMLSKCRINSNDELVYHQKNNLLNKGKAAREDSFQSSPTKHEQSSLRKQELLLSTPPKQKYQSAQNQSEASSVKYQSKNQQSRTNSQIKIHQTMNKLHMLYNYECRECGMRFATESARKQHTEQHIKYKLRQLDLAQAKKYGSIIKNPNKLKTPALWINPRAEEQELSCHIVLPQKQADINLNLTTQPEDNYIKNRTQEETQIEQPIFVKKQQICPLCCLSFKETMFNQQWVIKNAIHVDICSSNAKTDQTSTLMHLQCSKILLQCQKKQDNTLP